MLLSLQRLTKLLKGGLLLTLLLAMTACANKKGAGQGGQSDEMGAMGDADSMRFYGSDLNSEEQRSGRDKNTYYFDYDRYEVSEQDVARISAHANKLLSNPQARVRVEGHADERGSREYNVALGERRAKAVTNVLLLKGVNQNQLNMVSYGKEKPASLGHDESAWSRNRRAVIVYEE